GSMDRTSMSIPSRSLIAFAYSTRLRRWMGGRPGSGWAAAARSSAVARFEIRSWYEALSGRGRPAGGIAADRSFRTTFSHTGAAPSSANAVRKIRALGIDIALTIPPMLVLADPGSQMQAESLTRCRRPFSLRYGGGHLLAAAVAIGSLGVGGLAAGASDTRLA